MWRHNFLLIYRNFIRNKASFLINLIGLSTGLACTILIYLWVTDELKVDKFHERDAQLYQVMQRISGNKDDVLVWDWTPGLLAETLAEEMPEVELALPMVWLDDTGVIGHDETNIKAGELYAGSDFFNLFSFELLTGDKATVLQDINSVVISDELSLKLFGTTKGIVGKTIEWKRTRENVSGDYMISGVFRNPPVNSTIQFDLVFTYERYFKGKPDLQYWRNSEPWTFVALRPGTDPQQFDRKIEGLMREKNEDSKNSTLFLRKFSDSYLYGNFENGVQVGGRISYVRLFSIIAFFIVLIASINFMNLSTARSSRRSKEVGIKKTVGASRVSLIIQYLAESTLLAFISLFAALCLVNLALPQFNLVTDKNLALSASPGFVAALFGIALITGLLSGSYPALYLSRFKPIGILKGGSSKSPGALWARKGLVVFQFVLSILLIVSVFVVYHQLQYIQSKNLGYDRDNVLVFHKDGTIRENTEPFLEEIKKISGVASASTFDGDMAGNYGFSSTIRWPGYEKPENPIRFGIMIVGQDIIETLDLELVAGTNFPEQAGPYAKVLLNETAAAVIGFDDPVGQIITHRREEYEISGVVRDFHFESLYDEVKPCILRRGSYGNNIYVKIKAGAEQESIAQIEEVYQTFNPGLAFEFKFLDDQYQSLYMAEKRVATLSKYFAGFAILISCLGLFGLAAFSAERRTKEIGIRKILGSSVVGIIGLLSSELIRMVVVALMISLPLSLLIARRWLDSFAFRIELQPWFFIAAGLAVILVAAITIGFHSVKAAFANPVESLRQD